MTIHVVLREPIEIGGVLTKELFGEQDPNDVNPTTVVIRRLTKWILTSGPIIDRAQARTPIDPPITMQVDPPITMRVIVPWHNVKVAFLSDCGPQR